MRVGVAWRSLVGCVLCGLGLAVCVPSASAEGSVALGGTGGSPLESPLVLPESQSLLGGQGVGEAEEVRRDSPEAVAARSASARAFEGLSSAQAAKLAEETFPGLVDHLAGGPPQLPAGQTITGYLSDDAAQVDLGGGKHAVIESMAPIAVENSSSGRRVPVNLGLVEAGGGFQPATPVVGVQIPKRLGEGVRLPGVGVSLTPVDGPLGAPLGGSQGAMVGATVLYANTQTDMTSVIKPTTAGFAADTLLLSEASPQQIYFRVGMPEGASLVQAKDESGTVEVLEEGTAIATISAPRAVDAAGTAVPVLMSVSGNTLVLSVADHAAEYQYPVEVDPEVTGKDVQLTKEGSKRSNWEFYTGKGNGKNEPSTNFASSEVGGILKTYGVHEYKEGEEAFWVYQTRGVSKIYQFKGETEASNKEDHIESIVELQYGEVKTEHGVTEAKKKLSTETEGTSEYKQKEFPVLCPSGTESCPESAGHEGNAVHFQQSVVNKPTSKYSFSDELDKGTVYISEPEKTHSTTSYNSTSTEFEIEIENSKKEKEKVKRKNALYGSSNWLSEFDGAIQFIAKDTGIGVAKSILEYENSGKWEAVSGSEHNYLTGDLCKGVQCEAKQEEYWTLNPHLPNGEDKIRYRAEEAFGQETHQTESLESEGVGTVKVDTSKPHSIFIGGLPYGNELSEKSYKITAYATDGEGSTIPSSGISSLAVFIENSKGEKKEIAKTGGTGECSEPKGQCTASAEYTINGAEIGAGHHGIVIVAKDRAGNEGREEETISIRHSTPVPVGPGDVDLESGDFTLGPTDVSLGGGLSVGRVYSSRDLTAGAEGGSLLGPQWSLSVGSEESLIELADKSVMVTSGNGGQTIFAATFNEKHEPTGKFEAPPGDSNLTMTLEENEKHEKLAYYLKDPAEGTSTKFTFSSTAKVWVPAAQEGPVPTDTVSYVYETAEVGGKKVTRPSEERGATPAKVSCAPKMEPGCRTLKFTYATKTKSEIGEGPTEWGEYEGRLSRVSYEGYNPATKKMTETPIPVAEYAYDKQGRLRGEWDPRVSPALKTTYGYDVEGHVTALDPPGQEPWAFTYGTIAGDAGSGRLIKVTRAPVSAGLWGGALPSNTGEVPTITGTPVIGVRMSVSNGVWSNSPIVYAYQWQDCSLTGGECAAIPGATNANYTPVSSDVGHTLVAQVTATNGGGSVTVSSKASLFVGRVPQPTYTSQFSAGSPVGIAMNPEGDLWITKGDAAEEFNTAGTKLTKFENGSGLCSLGTAAFLADNGKSDLWLATNNGNTNGKVLDYTEGGSCLGPYEIITPGTGVALSSNGDTWVTENSGKVSEYIKKEGELIKRLATVGKEGAGNGELKYPGGLAIDAHGDLWIADIGNHRVQELAENGTYVSQFGARGSAAGQFEWFNAGAAPEGGLALDASGNIWVADTGNDRVKEFNEKGEFLTMLGSEGTGNGQLKTPDDVALDAKGNIWVTDHGNGRLEEWEPTTATVEGEAHTPSPGTTIEYNVPVSGTGAPHNMGASDVAKWGQKAEEAPEEATAIFPPDSPQGWPVQNPVTYSSSFGSEGTGNGQFRDPEDVAIDSKGDLWVLDYLNNRVEEFGEGGEYLTKFGSKGSGNGQISGANALATDSKGDVWVADTSNNRIEEFGSKGEYLTKIGTAGTGNGQFNGPEGVAIAANGNIWVSDTYNGRLEEFNEKGEFLKVVGSHGSGEGELGEPEEIAIGPKGNVWVTDWQNDRVEEFNEAGEYIREFGTEGTGHCQFVHPVGISVDSRGEVFVSDTQNNRVEVFNESGEYLTQYGSKGSGAGQFDYPVGIATGSKSELWVVDALNNRVEKWGGSYPRATVYYLDGQGRLVNTAAPSTGTYGSISTTEYNEINDVVRTISPDNRAAALKEGCESESNCASAKAAKLLSSENTYNGEGEKETEVLEPGTQLILSRGPEHMVKYVKGEEHYKAGEHAEEAMARSLTKYFYNEGAPTENPRTKKKEAYDLATTTQNFAELINKEGKGGETVDESETKTSYSGQEDLGWELRAPTSVTSAPGSLNLTSTTEYYESGEAMGKVKETRTPKGSGGKSAHDSKIVYYGMEENKEYAECGKHPEWAGLVCETLPAKQPETTGVPNLSMTKRTYNIWNEPETVVETFPKSGSIAEHTRTTKDEYDSAGRMKTSEETSTATTETIDMALPKVTAEYNTAMGALEKQSTTGSGKTKTITNKYNTLGQIESYTDADGNVTKFKHAGPENDGLLEEVSDSSDEGTSSQQYTYGATTKRLERLVDSAGGTFTASYDTEGKLSSEVYPNGMCANYTDNSVGEATHIEYTKTTTCSEKEGVWFNETKTPSIRGEVMSKTSTLASEEYGYDTLGRLTEVHETPASEYCKTRLYEYEAESNRTKQTTREPNSKKECATEGGTVQEHAYDEANRLIDSGITYDPLGNVTKLPSGDAESHALESTFYVDNAVATQTQNGVTNDYYMDPGGRVRETITGAKKLISHYDGSGEAVAWTCEGTEKAETCESGGKWTRNIPGIDGTLSAVENGKGATYETPILQLHDLQGDVVATIKDKTGETKLESTYNATEFGVPNGGKEPPKFAWLGAEGVEKSLASGVVTVGATSYVPQTGRPLQSEEVAPPGCPDGSGGQAATFMASPWNLQGAERVGAEAPGKEAGREMEAAIAAAEAAGIDPEGLVTGKEAQELAHDLSQSAHNLGYYANEAEFCESAQCELYLESGEKEDGALAKELEGCYFQVHNAGTVHGHYYTKTCLLDFNYDLYEDNYVVQPGWHVSICFSFLVGKNAITYSTSKWWCESDKKWHDMSNRGFWHDYHS